MINLLPPDHKQAIRFARFNSTLVKWLSGIGIAAAGIAVITGGSLFYLRQDSSSLRTSIEHSKAELESRKEDATLQQAAEMSGNVKLAVDVLSNEVLFSKLLRQIGFALPAGTVLQSLSLTSDLGNTGIDLQIGSLDYETGTRAHVNLNDSSNGIFEKADLNSVTCETGTEEEEPSPYPCQVSIRALFMEENPFLFISKENDS